MTCHVTMGSERGVKGGQTSTTLSSEKGMEPSNAEVCDTIRPSAMMESSRSKRQISVLYSAAGVKGGTLQRHAQ